MCGGVEPPQTFSVPLATGFSTGLTGRSGPDRLHVPLLRHFQRGRSPVHGLGLAGPAKPVCGPDCLPACVPAMWPSCLPAYTPSSLDRVCRLLGAESSRTFPNQSKTENSEYFVIRAAPGILTTS